MSTAVFEKLFTGEITSGEYRDLKEDLLTDETKKEEFQDFIIERSMLAKVSREYSRSITNNRYLDQNVKKSLYKSIMIYSAAVLSLVILFIGSLSIAGRYFKNEKIRLYSSVQQQLDTSADISPEKMKMHIQTILEYEKMQPVPDPDKITFLISLQEDYGRDASPEKFLLFKQYINTEKNKSQKETPLLANDFQLLTSRALSLITGKSGLNEPVADIQSSAVIKNNDQVNIKKDSPSALIADDLKTAEIKNTPFAKNENIYLSDNLIANPGFEEQRILWEVPGSADRDNPNILKIVENNPLEGKYNLRFISGHGGYIGYKIDLKNNKHYSLNLNMRIDKTEEISFADPAYKGRAGVQVMVISKDWKALAESDYYDLENSKAGEWLNIRLNFTTVSEFNNIRVKVNGNHLNWHLSLDDISLREIK